VLVDLGAEGEFAEGKIRVLEVEGRELGILRWNGEFYAFRNVCPHLGASVCKGTVRPFLTVAPDDPWQLTTDHNRPLIICPWHRWPFDAASGQSLVDRLRLRVYPIEADGGRVVVDVPPRREIAEATV